MMVAAAAIVIPCFWDFASRGLETPAPFDSPSIHDTIPTYIGFLQYR